MYVDETERVHAFDDGHILGLHYATVIISVGTRRLGIDAKIRITAKRTPATNNGIA